MEEKLISYLLGELSEEEESQLEAEYLWDKERREQILLAEDELIYAYVRNELPAVRRESFEKHFLTSPRRREGLRFAQAMASYLSRQYTIVTRETAKPVASVWQPYLALFDLRRYTFAQLTAVAALLILLLGSGLLVRESIQLRQQIEHLQGENSTLKQHLQPPSTNDQERLHIQELARQLENEQNLRSQLERELAQRSTLGATIPSFTLTSILVRDSAQEITIPANAAFIKLRLGVDNDEEYGSLQIQLLLEGSKEIWRQGLLKVRQQGAARFIVVRLPTELLPNNDYIIKLYGVAASSEQSEELATYSFQVRRK
ncbi:MAG: hypothetical protein AB1489_26655 [Acidobacteriota bacterium]